MSLYYHDVHIEEVTERKQTVLGKIVLYAPIVMGIITFILGFLDRGMFFLCFLFVLMYYFLGKVYSSVDFETDYTNGILDIDAIYGKSKRKSIVSVDTKKIKVMAVSKTDPVKPYIGSSMKTYDCTSHDKDKKYYCMIFENDGNNEEKLLFEPGEELLNELKRNAPDRIHI
ncbi:MAG: hypothetical protein IIZ61_05770 [Lachnospiraceae bacterium]|nr:hypothetical protein [Lachnospiraceae bacterium]